MNVSCCLVYVLHRGQTRYLNEISKKQINARKLKNVCHIVLESLLSGLVCLEVKHAQ